MISFGAKSPMRLFRSTGAHRGGGRSVINITCEASHADHDDDGDDGDANYNDDHDFNLDNITIVLSQF